MLLTPPMEETELLGEQRLCPGCREYWPNDQEFFMDENGLCRACDYDVELKKNGALCCEGDCMERRKSKADPRCSYHSKLEAERRYKEKLKRVKELAFEGGQHG